MNKILYPLLLITMFFISCGSDDEKDDKLLQNLTVDLSDFSVYVGSDNGAVGVTFNNLKNSELVRRYFSGKYTPDLYRNYSMRFADNKLTYIYLDGNNQRQIVADYYYTEDSLFVEKGDGTRLFVALGSNPRDLYKKFGLARYYNPTKGKLDTISQENIELLDLETMLRLRGFSNKEEMTNPTDTLIWCNVIYRFE